MNERKLPGLWKCPKCNCVWGQFVIHAHTGGVGVKVNAPSPTCPNNCGPMAPIMEDVH